MRRGVYVHLAQAPRKPAAALPEGDGSAARHPSLDEIPIGKPMPNCPWASKFGRWFATDPCVSSFAARATDWLSSSLRPLLRQLLGADLRRPPSLTPRGNRLLRPAARIASRSSRVGGDPGCATNTAFVALFFPCQRLRRFRFSHYPTVFTSLSSPTGPECAASDAPCPPPNPGATLSASCPYSSVGWR